MAITGVVLVCLFAVVSSSEIPNFSHPQPNVDADTLKKMLDHMSIIQGAFCDQDQNKDETCELDPNDYDNPDACDSFKTAYNEKQFPEMTKTFSILHKDDTSQVRLVYGPLYFAKDWDTFIKTAKWMRKNMNPGLFLCAYTAACIYRSDNVPLLMCPWDAMPQFAASKPAIEQGKKEKENCNGDMVIPSEYPNKDQSVDYRVAYLTGDIGMMAYMMMDGFHNSFWVTDELRKEKPERDGESFYNNMQFCKNRYVMANIAEGIEVKDCKLDNKLPGFDPDKCYPDDSPMTARPNSVEIDKSEYWKDCKELLDSLQKKIDKKEEGLDCNEIGRLMYKFNNKLVPDKPPVSLFFSLIWMIAHTNQAQDGTETCPALDHYATLASDPAYYCVLNVLLKLMDKHKGHLKKYTKDELGCDFAELKKVETTPLNTYFDEFLFSMNGIVGAKENCNMSASSKRLNHDRFTTTYTIKAKAEDCVLVRSFVCPREDHKGKPMKMDKASELCTPIDIFPYKLAKGDNVITRESIHSTVTHYPDFSGIDENIRKIKAAQDNKDSDSGAMFNTVSPCGYPHRHLLPKGKEAGFKVFIYTIVSKYDCGQIQSDEDTKKFDGFVTCGSRPWLKYPDDKPMGFPFDRKGSSTSGKNMYTLETVITHRN